MHLAQPRGATPRPRSGAEARRTPCPRGGGQEELPHVRGQGQRPRVPGCDGAGTAERSYPTPKVRGGSWEELPCIRGQGWWSRGATLCPRPRAVSGRTYPMPEARDSSPEDLPYTQSQGLRPGGANPSPKSGGCTGAGGPRGAIPRSRSEGSVVRRYPSSKVRSSSCALLEQP